MDMDNITSIKSYDASFNWKWLVLAAKYHTRQKIIHNSVKTCDILIKLKVLESL